MEETKIKQNLSGSLIKGFALIELLSEYNESSLTELSNRLEMNISSVHRLLSTLVHLDYVTQNSVNRKYRLTSRLFEIGSRTTKPVSLEEAAAVVMERISEDTGETVNLAVLDKGEVVYIKKIESRHPLRMDISVGTRVPAHCTSLGKALIAHMPEHELKALFTSRSMGKMTSKSITGFSKLKAALASVRNRGYAIDDEEFSEGIRCVGAPIRDENGGVIGALSIAGPSLRFTDREIKQYALFVVEGAGEIAGKLVNTVHNR
ncbi:MAG: IclR family transcriptional regulator [Deltaproteobacteria bacterium]|nr:IclR family transcriptional regulator [Deltaproteobacteria bacterium]